MLACMAALTTMMNIVGNGAGGIFLGGSVDSSWEARIYYDRGLLAMLAEEPPLYFFSLLSLPYF